MPLSHSALWARRIEHLSFGNTSSTRAPWSGVSHSAAGPQPPMAPDHSTAHSLAWPLRLETSRAPTAENEMRPMADQRASGALFWKRLRSDGRCAARKRAQDTRLAILRLETNCRRLLALYAEVTFVSAERDR